MTKKIMVLLLVLFIPGLLFAGGAGEQQESEGPDYRDPEVLMELITEDSVPYILVDVRTPAEYASGHIPEAVNIPVNVIRAAAPDVPQDSLVIVYCRTGNRSATAAQELEKLGYTQVVDFGGINRWPYEVE